MGNRSRYVREGGGFRKSSHEGRIRTVNRQRMRGKWDTDREKEWEEKGNEFKGGIDRERGKGEIEHVGKGRIEG